MENKPIVENVVIDGGPCSGKTTGLVKISEALMQKGIIPMVVPEAATILIGKGITPAEVGMGEFQKKVIELQYQNEEYWWERARKESGKTGKRVVLLHDRALLTGAAYLDLNEGENQLKIFQKKILGPGPNHMNVESIRARYKGVIHLVTAANGAEEHYTLANNEARTEDPETARYRDQRTQDAWLAHGHLAVLPNRDSKGEKISFRNKIKKANAEVLRIIGYPVPIELEDKFKLRSFDPSKLPVKYEAVNIRQTYLIPEAEGSEERVRMRNWMNFYSYVRTTKSPGPGKGRVEIEYPILSSDYRNLLTRKDPETFTIRKTRYCFLHNHQYFEVDVFHESLKGEFYMERERTDQNDLTELPSFIDVESDVTGMKEHGNFALAHRQTA